MNGLRSGPRTEQEENELADLNAKLRGIEDIEQRLYTFQDGQLRGTNGRESAPGRHADGSHRLTPVT